MDKQIIRDIIDFTIEKEIKTLYKQFLIIAEDTVCNPPEDPYNYNKEEEYQKLRKRILDSGNEAYRNIIETIDKFDLDFKQKK